MSAHCHNPGCHVKLRLPNIDTRFGSSRAGDIVESSSGDASVQVNLWFTQHFQIVCLHIWAQLGLRTPRLDRFFEKIDNVLRLVRAYCHRDFEHTERVRITQQASRPSQKQSPDWNVQRLGQHRLRPANCARIICLHGNWLSRNRVSESDLLRW
eukprot:CAMPEP_0172893208 /NCGR_PEP_ID=MMETSP1075-20121228/147940_1 /TAXON_ID=2916 /ORGANISM="Ceratium fusus, Strain PA161109" /LENGTH=153 /DNA_ID=CAMNT_0013748025 /DNA_START=154 /DNA_END=612 /DNA_ORIENTATION=+